VRVFGSVVHGTDTDDSGLDLLVDPLPDTTLMDIGAIRFELNKLLTIPVDVVTLGHCRPVFVSVQLKRRLRYDESRFVTSQRLLGEATDLIKRYVANITKTH
jgi:predicted nucleotidyltransferase